MNVPYIYHLSVDGVIEVILKVAFCCMLVLSLGRLHDSISWKFKIYTKMYQALILLHQFFQENGVLAKIQSLILVPEKILLFFPLVISHLHASCFGSSYYS